MFYANLLDYVKLNINNEKQFYYNYSIIVNAQQSYSNTFNAVVLILNYERMFIYRFTATNTSSHYFRSFPWKWHNDPRLSIIELFYSENVETCRTMFTSRKLRDGINLNVLEYILMKPKKCLIIKTSEIF